LLVRGTAARSIAALADVALSEAVTCAGGGTTLSAFRDVPRPSAMLDLEPRPRPAGDLMRVLVC